MNILNMLKSLIRLGTVTAIYDERGYLQVTFFDKDETPRDVPMFSFVQEYNMPEMKDTVLCIFLPGSPEGFCLGKWFSVDNKPPVNKRTVWFKGLRKNGSMSFDDETETLTIKAKHIVFQAEDITTPASITADKDIKSGSISLTLHIHGNGNQGQDTTQPK